MVEEIEEVGMCTAQASKVVVPETEKTVEIALLTCLEIYGLDEASESVHVYLLRRRMGTLSPCRKLVAGRGDFAFRAKSTFSEPHHSGPHRVMTDSDGPA